MFINRVVFHYSLKNGMSKESLLRRGLKIPDKHAYCRRLLIDISTGETEFMERKFYELCFALYARFYTERLNPQLIYPYFVLLSEIFSNQPEIYTKEMRMIVDLGLKLGDFAQYSEEALQLGHIMLQINAKISLWQRRSHICRYCGHSLELLTQEIQGQHVHAS